MRRLLALVAFVAIISQFPAFGQGQKGNFALSMQGGGFGNLEDRFFKSMAFVVSGGLEYYPLNPVSFGIQFQFSPKGSFGGPVTLGVGSVSGSGYRRSDRLFQTTIFARPTVPLGSAVNIFGVAGMSLTKVTRLNGEEIAATGPSEAAEEGERIGAKFGGGALIHLKSNTHLNFTAAYDTQPRKLLSAQAGLTFFFDPFSRKSDSNKSSDAQKNPLLPHNLLSLRVYK
ncbi:MAG: hypothetical protein L0196_01960 [candidate division Zixibacteria bacterium]|nr:hypothetical protein [candidate division Zixibacteria bacterium]